MNEEETKSFFTRAYILMIYTQVHSNVKYIYKKSEKNHSRECRTVGSRERDAMNYERKGNKLPENALSRA